MAKTQNKSGGIGPRPSRPPRTPEERENHLVSLAYDLVESRIRDGTATSQELVHFLKLGTTRNQLEQDKLRHENEYLEAKKNRMESEERREEVYGQAIEALKAYQGNNG